jgi:hypothetical protein
MSEARHAYYSCLNDEYFSAGDIVLELGAESRKSWVDSIDRKKIVVARSTWSRQQAHPSIWQIPMQQIIAILDSPRHAWMARSLTTIVMENTLGCLPQPVPGALFSFARKYGIRIVDLSYRPLCSPRLSDIQARSDRRFNPDHDCPALAVAARELLRLVVSKDVDAGMKRILYIYRPPIGSAIVGFHFVPPSPDGEREWLKLQGTARQSGGAVQLVEVPAFVREGELGEASLRMFALLLRSLLLLQERPSSKYRVHMMKFAPQPQLSAMNAWFLGIRRQAERAGLVAQLHIDSVGGKGGEERLHTAGGELINPIAFIGMWVRAGFPEKRVRDYAYGIVGCDSAFMGEFLRRHSFAGDVPGIFQASRLQIEPG